MNMNGYQRFSFVRMVLLVFWDALFGIKLREPARVSFMLGAPVVMQRQVPVIQKAQRTVDVPLLQYVGTAVDVPVAKQHENCMTKHNEIEMDKKLSSAQFRTESKKQIVFDSEGRSDLCDIDCISEDGCSQTKLSFVSSRSLRAIPQERVEQRIVERNIDVPVPGACLRVNRRTDRRCACATVDSGRDGRSDEVGST